MAITDSGDLTLTAGQAGFSERESAFAQFRSAWAPQIVYMYRQEPDGRTIRWLVNEAGRPVETYIFHPGDE